VTLKYLKGTANTLYKTWTVTSSCAGGFTTSVVTPTGVLETDHVQACDTAGRCFTAKITLIL